METVYAEIATEPTKLTFESDPRMVVKATALLLKRILSDNVYTVMFVNVLCFHGSLCFLRIL